MFLSDHVPCLYKGAKLRLVDPADGNPQKRIAEATFVVDPFNATLATELGSDARRHLYDEDGEVRPELESIELRIPNPLQRVVAHTHRELKAFATLEPVAIGKITADKMESDKTGRTWLRFTFVLNFDLTTREARNFCIDAFGARLELSFFDIQPSLLPASERKRLASVAQNLGGAHAILDAVDAATPEERAALATMAAEVKKARARGERPAKTKGGSKKR